MDATAFVQSDIPQLTSTFDVWTHDSSYGGDWTQTGTADVHVYSASSQSQVVVEGSGEQATYSGLTTVTRDSNGDIIHDVEVNQQLRLDGVRYDVRAKHGVPNDHDPEFWHLGLDKANQSN